MVWLTAAGSLSTACRVEVCDPSYASVPDFHCTRVARHLRPAVALGCRPTTPRARCSRPSRASPAATPTGRRRHRRRHRRRRLTCERLLRALVVGERRPHLAPSRRASATVGVQAARRSRSAISVSSASSVIGVRQPLPGVGRATPHRPHPRYPPPMRVSSSPTFGRARDGRTSRRRLVRSRPHRHHPVAAAPSSRPAPSPSPRTASRPTATAT